MRHAAIIALLAAALFMVSPGIASSPRPVLASTNSGVVTGYFCGLKCTDSVKSLTLSGALGPNSVLAWEGENITLFNRKIGVYVDNEVPFQCIIVAAELKIYPLVIAGNAPNSTAAQRCPGAINALEWYPVGYQGAGIPPLPIPKASAYILQFRFHWPGLPAPTATQRATLLKQALRFHPQLILWY